MAAVHTGQFSHIGSSLSLLSCPFTRSVQLSSLLRGIIDYTNLLGEENLNMTGSFED